MQSKGEKSAKSNSVIVQGKPFILEACCSISKTLAGLSDEEVRTSLLSFTMLSFCCVSYTCRLNFLYWVALQLALLLHQELNSSLRVPRIPRVRQAGSLPHLSTGALTNTLPKSSPSSATKDQHLVWRVEFYDFFVAANLYTILVSYDACPDWYINPFFMFKFSRRKSKEAACMLKNSTEPVQKLFEKFASKISFR